MQENFSAGGPAAAGKFMLRITVFFLLFSFFFSLLPLSVFEHFYATGTLFFLGILGFSGEIVYGEPVLMFLDVFSLPLGFSYLCTGLLELCLVWAAVASTGVDIKSRAAGIILGAAANIAFNFARIAGSVLIIYYFGLNAGNFSHDVMFRVFLFFAIAGFYWLWLGWATGRYKNENFDGDFCQ